MAKKIFILIIVSFLPALIFGQYMEVEPNDSMGQANMLALGDSSIILARFNSSIDEDYFSFEMNDSSMYYLTSIESGDNISPNIELFRQGTPGNILTSDISGRNGNGNFRLSGYVPEVSGLYYAKVFNTGSLNGNYKVRLAGGRSHTELLANEPDNTIDISTNASVALGDTVYGAIYPADDIDFYRISGEEGQKFTVGTTHMRDLHPRDTDSFIVLHDASGNEIFENDDVGTVSTPSGNVNCTFSQITGVFPTTGDYYLAVRSYYNSEFGASMDEAAPPTGEYGVYYFLGEPVPDDFVARFPHLEMPTVNSILVQWNTLQSEPTTVLWGADESCGNVISNPEHVNEHLVKISGLEPDSKYYYRVVLGNDTTNCEHFYTAAPSSKEEVTFFVISDTSPYEGFGSSPAQRAVAAQILKKDYDFGLHGGDVNQHHGEEYDLVYYQPYKDILKNATIFPCIGNHDTYHDDALTYRQSFNLPHNNPANTERYYSFNWGHAHFISIDTDSPYNPGSPQYKWLVEDLQSDMRAETMWTFVYFHKPPWSEGWPGYSGEAGVRTHLVPVFEDHGVDMIFSGHTHDYERGVLNDVYYIITGGGGAPLEAGIQAYDHNHVSVWINQHQFTHVRLTDKMLELKSINKNGDVIDNLIIDKNTSGVKGEKKATPEDIALFHNYPNPFNASTVISYHISSPSHVKLEVFSTLGQKVRTVVNQQQTAGQYEVNFDAGDLPTGMYYYRIETDHFEWQKKMLLVK